MNFRQVSNHLQSLGFQAKEQYSNPLTTENQHARSKVCKTYVVEDQFEVNLDNSKMLEIATNSTSLTTCEKIKRWFFLSFTSSKCSAKTIAWANRSLINLAKAHITNLFAKNAESQPLIGSYKKIRNTATNEVQSIQVRVYKYTAAVEA